MDTSTGSTPPSSSGGIFSHGQQALKGTYALFPGFKHEHHDPIINVNAVADEQLTLGQRVADSVAETMGSWKFIITQSIILLCWVVINSLAWFFHFDPYPFILLNLAMSAQAAFATPLIMMSQNRQSAKDRLTAENDYKTDMKGEQEICHIMEHLHHQDTLILQIVQQLQEQNRRLEVQHQAMLARLSELDPALATNIQQGTEEQQ